MLSRGFQASYSAENRYKMLRNSVVSMIRKSRKAYFRNLNPSNKKLFWKSIKCLSKQKSAFPTLSLNDTSASTDSAKATMLNNFFSSCLNTAVPPLSQQSDPPVTVQMTSSAQKMKWQLLLVHWIHLKPTVLMESLPEC